MTFAPECCDKCGKYTRQVCEARGGDCDQFYRWLNTSGFWEEFRAWVLGGCRPEKKEVFRYEG